MLNTFPSAPLVEDLERFGFTVIQHAIRHRIVDALLDTGMKLCKRPAAIVERDHTQQLDCLSTRKVGSDRSFRTVARELEEALHIGFSRVGGASLPGHFRFSELRLLRYPPGSRGMPVHQDSPAARYLVAIVVLRQGGMLCLCEDEGLSGSIPICSAPGDVILMRGSGLWGKDIRPWHYVPPVSKDDCDRVTLGLRCIA